MLNVKDPWLGNNMLAFNVLRANFLLSEFWNCLKILFCYFYLFWQIFCLLGPNFSECWKRRWKMERGKGKTESGEESGRRAEGESILRVKGGYFQHPWMELICQRHALNRIWLFATSWDRTRNIHSPIKKLHVQFFMKKVYIFLSLKKITLKQAFIENFYNLVMFTFLK